MAIAEQFAGLQMEQLIGAPLRAAADASVQLANSTADFIDRVGFDKGKVRTVAFGYQKRSVNEDGTSNLDEMKVEVPVLAIVPIPNLQVDEVNILFDMEVKQSERQESSNDMSASLNSSVNFGFVKINVSGSVSAHQSHTRSSDNSAKYHVDVRAANHGTPEGLARVLDMMAANVAPVLVGSSLKDGNGGELPDKARIRAQRLKTLRQEISRLENRLGAAQGGLDNSLQQLKRAGASQWNIYRGMITKLVSAGTDKEAEENYDRAMAEVNQSWSRFESQAGELVKILADSQVPQEQVAELFALRALDSQGAAAAYTTGESCYDILLSAQKSAVENQRKVSEAENELAQKKAEYSDAVME